MAEGDIVRREVERTLVRGSWDAVEPRNFRKSFGDQDQAESYVFREAGFDPGDTFLYGIVRVRYESLRPTGNRRGWSQLGAQTKRDYLASQAAQQEAKAHGLTVPEWYRVAPDLKAFRRHAQGRTGREQGRDVEYLVYIARHYKGQISKAERVRIGRTIRDNQRKNRRSFKPQFG